MSQLGEIEEEVNAFRKVCVEGVDIVCARKPNMCPTRSLFDGLVQC
jgi:hypothetical protein